MSQNLAELLENLSKNSELSIHWIEDNYINLNTGICLVKNQVSYVNFYVKLFHQPRILFKSLI